MKLQNITLATTMLVLGLNAIDTYNAQATTAEPENTASIEYQIAQTSGKQDASDDEMLDALQERQKKIDRGLEKIRKVTGAEAESETPSTEEDSQTGDEMMDALQNRQEKINNLKELKNLQDKIEADSKNAEI